MIKIDQNIDLSNKNTFRIKVQAANWINYDDPNDLKELYSEGLFQNKWMHIGEGSNILFLEDFDGAILHSHIEKIEIESIDSKNALLTVGSGISLDKLIDFSISNNLWGIENLTMIPGTVGAAAVQNVGAYGVEFGQLVNSVTAFDTTTGQFETIRAADCDYGYRQSLFKTAKHLIVVEVKLSLRTTATPTLTYAGLQNRVNQESTQTDIRNAINEMRLAKLPSIEMIGSAGSYFKNPIVTTEMFKRAVEMSGITPSNFMVYDTNGTSLVKVSAASLIDACGLKGHCVGDAQVWEKQPLVIVNKDNASPSDIIRLENEIRLAVMSKFGIDLQPEVEHITNAKAK